MIKSNKLDVVYTSQGATVRDVPATVRDSGIRSGVQIWELKLTTNRTGSNVLPSLEAGDELEVVVNGTTVNTVFNTDVATTLSDFATDIAAEDFISGAVVEADFKVVVTSEVNVENALTGATVANSTVTQLTANERSELTAIPALVVLNQSALKPLRTEIVGTAPNTVTYAGFALPGANVASPVWSIQRITETATTTVIEFADGNEKMDNVWNDRASLSYS